MEVGDAFIKLAHLTRCESINVDAALHRHGPWHGVRRHLGGLVCQDPELHQKARIHYERVLSNPMMLMDRTSHRKIADVLVAFQQVNEKVQSEPESKAALQIGPFRFWVRPDEALAAFDAAHDLSLDLSLRVGPTHAGDACGDG